MNAVETLVKKRWMGKTHHIYTRFVNRVPIRDGEDALEVNWCELTITSTGGKRLYKNAFATDFTISKDNVEQIVADGRARHIKNQRGTQFRPHLLLALNLLAFLFHTALEFLEIYKRIRDDLPTRKTLTSGVNPVYVLQ